MARKESSITIAIPAYKRPRELDECIGSIISQKEFRTNNNFKILVIDDSPQHEGKTIIERYVCKYPEKIKYIPNKKNLGFELNILKLIKDVKTEYIFFITDDDKLKENSLANILNIISKYSPGLIVSSYWNKYLNGLSEVSSLFRKNFIVDKGDLETKTKIFSDSHILSGKIFKIDQIDIEGYIRHAGSFYPQMYLVGKCLLKSTTYYSSEPYIVHRVGNKVFWNYLDDYMVVGKMRIIDDLSLLDSSFANSIRRDLLRSFAYILYINMLKPIRIYLFIKKVISTSDLLHSPSDWLNVILGGLLMVVGKSKSFLFLFRRI